MTDLCLPGSVIILGSFVAWGLHEVASAIRSAYLEEIRDEPGMLFPGRRYTVKATTLERDGQVFSSIDMGECLPEELWGWTDGHCWHLSPVDGCTEPPCGREVVWSGGWVHGQAIVDEDKCPACRASRSA